MPELSGLAKKGKDTLLPLLRIGLGSYGKGLAMGLLLTFLAMVAAGSFGSRDGRILPRLVAALLVGIIGTVATAVLASKRAVFAVAEAALTQLALGTTLLNVTFQHLLRVTDDTERGERLGTVGNAVETRVPFAQAESRLKAAVARVTFEKAEVGGIRGRILRGVRSNLLARVSQITLARFREEGQRSGAVDLVRVRDELGQGLDALLVDQVASVASRSTWVIATVAVALSALVTYVVGRGM